MKSIPVIVALFLSIICITLTSAYADLSDGLVAWYPFNGNAYDESGNGNDGTVIGPVLIPDATGNPDSAYRFDGTDDYIDCGNGAPFEIQDEITVSAWINIASVGNDKLHIVSKWKSGPTGAASWTLLLDEQRHARFVVSNSSASTEAPLHLDTYTHIAGTYSAVDNIIRVYVNGEVVGTGEGNTGNISVTDADVYIGAAIYYYEVYFHGIIDDVRIYNRRLSSSEIIQLSDVWDDDGVPAYLDNCLLVSNPDQTDIDGDGLGKVCDNCPADYNDGQLDTDYDGQGDICDNCTDSDSDGYGDHGFNNNICQKDNCPVAYNPDQTDTDNDTIGNACDNCPENYNPDQHDTDGDGTGDACDEETTIWDGDYTITTEDDIEGLSGYAEVTGNLRIGISSNPQGNTPTTFENLEGLESLNSVGGDVSITWNENLTSLAGLDNLGSIGGSVHIGSNPVLVSCSGLESLTHIDGDLNIYNNGMIASLNGLDALTSVGGDLRILDNPMHDLSGLGNITSVRRILLWDNFNLVSLNGLTSLINLQMGLDIYNNDALSSLSGMDALTSIAGNLEVTDNDALSSLRGLENLAAVDGWIIVQDNDALTSMAGLDNVTTANSLSITNNIALASLNALYTITVFGNWLNVCDNEGLCMSTAYALKEQLRNNGFTGTADIINNSGLNDNDCDSIANPEDNCPNVCTPDQNDFDIDGEGNACDPDDNDEEPSIAFGPIRIEPMTFSLSDDWHNPTPVSAQPAAIGWIYDDDFAYCIENPSIVSTFQYRYFGIDDWNSVEAIHIEDTSAFVADLQESMGDEPIECRVSVTDCSEQTVYSPVFFIEVNQPPYFALNPLSLDPFEFNLSTDQAIPTVVQPVLFAVGWAYREDFVFCKDSPFIDGAWYYRESGDEWSEAQPVIHWGWGDGMVTDFRQFVSGQELEFKAEITDCTGLSTTSPVYYLLIDTLPPASSIGIEIFRHITQEMKQ